MSAAKIKNLYIARLTAQERPCFVCSKFTSVVLTSADNSNDDWFYTCRSHLGDFHFCSRITDPSSPKPTKQKTTSEKLKDKQPESDSVVDLVSSIGSAFKSWRNNNKTEEEKDNNKKEDKEDKEENEGKKENEEKDNKDEKEGKDVDKINEQKSSSPSSPSPSSPSSPVPPRFILQRDYFYLRQREYIKKLQKKQANETLKTLDFPSVPKVMPGSSSPTSK